MFKMVNELTIDDLFNKEHDFIKICRTVTGYDVTYNQAWCGIHRLTHITKLLLEDKIKIHWNHIYNHMKFEVISKDYTEKELLKVLFDTFSMNENFIINTNLEVVTSKKWVDESFSDCRLRCLWEVIDELGLKKYGYGNFISQKKVLKYYRPKGKIGEDQNLPLDLD